MLQAYSPGCHKYGIRTGCDYVKSTDAPSSPPFLLSPFPCFPFPKHPFPFSFVLPFVSFPILPHPNPEIQLGVLTEQWELAQYVGAEPGRQTRFGAL